MGSYCRAPSCLPRELDDAYQAKNSFKFYFGNGGHVPRNSLIEWETRKSEEK